MSERPLEAKRYSPTERRYRQPLPWKWIALVLCVVALGVGGYRWRKHRLLEAHRDEVFQKYESLFGPTMRSVEQLRSFVLGHAATVAKGGAEPYLSGPITDWTAIREGGIAYLLTRSSILDDPKTLSEAMQTQSADSIAGCLGVPLRPVKEAVSPPTILGADWHNEVENADSDLSLFVREKELSRSSNEDLPAIRAATDTKYLL
ncbi:MAG: hypothetical protein R3A47_01310 [Polyangiales bacterium]